MVDSSKTQTNKTEQTNSQATCNLKVWDGKNWHELQVKRGLILRQALMENELSPHDAITNYINCRGDGVCAFCSVRLNSDAPQPKQLFDRFTSKLGWRLSCQVPVDRDLEVSLI